MPASDRTLRIGILGAAAIAPLAAVRPARSVPRAEVVAVAARDRHRAERFAAKHGIARVHDSYADLVADPELDAVYNPLPNSLHAHWTIAALEAGKHVLCEKPFTSNAVEARNVKEVADATGLVVMEAFHYRYHPLMRRAVEVVRSGELGEVRRYDAWMLVPLFKRDDIRFHLDLSGGAVMDLVYPLHQVRHLSGEEPTVRSAQSRERSPKVDRWTRAHLEFPSGAVGQTTMSLYGAVPLSLGFRVVGSEGTLKVRNPTMPQLHSSFTVVGPDGGRRRETFPRTPTYQYQLEAFTEAVLDGAPLLTAPDDSVRTMELVDSVYRASGLGPRVI